MSMLSRFDTEKLVGVQLRAVAGDISRQFRDDTLKPLYSDSDGTMTEIGTICHKWHWAVCAYFSDLEKARPYTYLIQMCYKRNINLEKSEFWKLLLRLKLPEEFFKMMDKFTQIPQLAARDASKPKTDVRSRWE